MVQGPNEAKYTQTTDNVFGLGMLVSYFFFIINNMPDVRRHNLKLSHYCLVNLLNIFLKFVWIIEQGTLSFVLILFCCGFTISILSFFLIVELCKPTFTEANETSSALYFAVCSFLAWWMYLYSTFETKVVNWTLKVDRFYLP